MEQVDLILAGGTVVSMDTDFSLYPDGAVAIRDERIVAVGPRETLLAAYDATEALDCSDSYILPGLVNAHTHAPMTLLRGLADDLRLDVWLMGYVMPTEREFVNPEVLPPGRAPGLRGANPQRYHYLCGHVLLRRRDRRGNRRSRDARGAGTDRIALPDARRREL